MTMLELVRSVVLDITKTEYIYTLNESLISTQVTEILRDTYFSIIDGKDWPNLYKAFQLTQSSADTPTHMTFSNTVMDVQYIKYNIKSATDTKDKYVEIKYLLPKDFMEVLDARDSSADNVDVITDSTGIYLNIINNRAPTGYTSFDEKTIIFDSYDSGVETHLKTIKTQCYGKIYPTVVMDDDEYFDLPVEAFSYLLHETKSTASLKILEKADEKSEQESVTQRRRMSQEAWKLHNGITYPNYGRRGKK